MRSPSAIAGKTLPRTPSTRNLVVGVGAVEGVSYGDGVARVGLTRGVVYHQKVKANLNRLQTKKNNKINKPDKFFSLWARLFFFSVQR